MHMVEHDADGFYADAVAFCEDIYECQEKDIVLCPIEQDISVQRL